MHGRAFFGPPVGSVKPGRMERRRSGRAAYAANASLELRGFVTVVSFFEPEP